MCIVHYDVTMVCVCVIYPCASIRCTVSKSATSTQGANKVCCVCVCVCVCVAVSGHEGYDTESRLQEPSPPPPSSGRLDQG